MENRYQNIAQMSGQTATQNLFGVWAALEIFTGLLYRRRNELRFDTTKTTESELVPENEINQFTAEAIRDGFIFITHLTSETNTGTQRKAG